MMAATSAGDDDSLDCATTTARLRTASGHFDRHAASGMFGHFPVGEIKYC
jgi:hypothetical protein